MSETERELLDAVLADPDADAPRLAYAAWAKRQDDSRRPFDFSAYGAADHVTRRGFVEGMSLSGRAFISLGERIMRLTPLRDVRLVGVQPFIGELARCPHLARLRRLDLRGNRIGPNGMKTLAASNFLGGLRELGLSGNAVRAAGLDSLLAESWSSNLTVLELAANHLGPEQLSRLNGSNLPKLESLDLSDNSVGAGVVLPAGLRRLRMSHCGLGPASFQAGHPESLTELDLSHNSLASGGAVRLAGDTALSQLTVLDLSFNDIDSSGAGALCRMTSAGALIVLRLRGNRITDAGARSLAEADFGSVVELDLGTNPIGDGGAAAVVRGEAFTNLERLSLANCGITDAGVKGLAATGALGGLRELSLAWNPIGDVGVTALAACPDLAGLLRLDLTGTRIGYAGAVALSESPHLVRLESVVVGENHRLSADAVTLLRDRYNDGDR
jgi:uncharacterized protein (TIGR02996 family)